MNRCAITLLLCVLGCGGKPEVPQGTTAQVSTSAESTSQAPAPESDEAALLRDFGAKLRMVSLLAPPDVLERSMREHYAPFVAPELLERWIANPSEAPGRQVSSPWPERIEVATLTREDTNRSVVDGAIVEVTSEGGAAVQRIPVRLVLERAPGGAWRITGGETLRQAAREPGANEAVAVLEDYYDAIARRDYERAYRAWSGNGEASGQTFAEFQRGFAGTATVEVETGTPGRMDPAAGSRFIEIPVEITATTTSGTAQHFRGTYVLRRSVVDGATAEQREWHISAARIRDAGVSAAPDRPSRPASPAKTDAPAPAGESPG